MPGEKSTYTDSQHSKHSAPYVVQDISVQKIDPSPYQYRRYFDEDKLKIHAASIEREGLISPIVLRPVGGRYELICGERRFRAVRDYTAMKTIRAQIMPVDELQARRIAAAENMQREDLSAIETIEAIVCLVDVELMKNKEYASMGKEPADRVKTLLGRLHSVTSSRQRGSKISKKAELLLHKFMQQVEDIFTSLPNPLEWRSFYNNNLPLLADFCEQVQQVSIQRHLNKSQTMALARLKEVSEDAFQALTGQVATLPGLEFDQADQNSAKIHIAELSAREIEQIGKEAVKKKTLAEQGRARISPSVNQKVKAVLMSRLGIPVDRIAARLTINRTTVMNYANDTLLVQSIRGVLDKGVSVPEAARKHGCPESLVWSIALEGKSDQERFKALNWGLRTWYYWYWADVDHRFGDEWPGRVPAQLVAHTLFYFTKEGYLVFDPMAGGGVVSDTCLAFNRKCWSFDLVDRPDSRPEIEPYQWNLKSLRWPVPPKGRRAGKGKDKPDLIFLDPPYFNKLADQYDQESVSSLDRENYLRFFQELFLLAKNHAKSSTRIAFLNADWRDFQGVSALEENPAKSILMSDYIDLLKSSGWQTTHIIDCPLSTQRFQANVVSQMQKNRILGVVRRSLIIGKKITVHP